MDKVVLTFDDGPDPKHTARILDALAKENVPAVFFVLGERVRAPGGRELVRRAVAEGHMIGNHSFSHQRLTNLPPEEVRSEIMRTHELIAEFESKPRLFRPPYGGCNDTVKAIAKELNYKMLLWNVSFEDWREENQPSEWVNIAMREIADQHLAVCLGHDLAHTAEHLPQLLERVKRLRNRKFVRYDNRRNLKWFAQGIGRKALDCWNWARPNRVEQRIS